MSSDLTKSLSDLVQDLRERAWDAATCGADPTRPCAGRDADDIQEEIDRRLRGIRGFRGTEAQHMLDILDGRAPADLTEIACLSRSYAGRACMHQARNHPERHRTLVHDDGTHEEWE